MRNLNWPAIVFGAASGFAASLLLFAISFGLGSNLIVLLIIQCIGFFVAGYVSGRFALSEPMLSGGLAAMVLWLGVVLLTFTGETFNFLGYLVLGLGAIGVGPYGGALGYNRRKV